MFRYPLFQEDLLNVIVESEIKFPRSVVISRKTKDIILNMLEIEE